MKVNLGCGKDVRHGYVNVDNDPSITGVYQLDIRQFPDAYRRTNGEPLEEVLMLDVLQCLTPDEFATLLAGLVPLMHPDGKIVIKDTDYSLLAHRIVYSLANIREVNAIYAPGRRGIFNRANVVAHAESVGLYEAEAYYNNVDFGVTLRVK